MPRWDPDTDFVVDDVTLLRAINMIEGKEEGYLHSLSDSTIRAMVIKRSTFKLLGENEHLRALLRDFLEANIAVAEKRLELKTELDRDVLSRWFRRPIIVNLEADLKDLEATRDEAFKKYEMLRRLTDWENVFLKRIPA